jgi:hypothetical protein
VWAHRFPTDALGRLVLVGPALQRIPAGDGTTVVDHVAGRVPGRLVPELFSSAARRVLRPGPARTALARPGAAHPAAFLEAANKCPPRPPRDRAAVVVEGIVESLDRPLDRALVPILEAARERLSDEEELGRFSVAIDRMPSWVFGRGSPWPDLLAALDPGDERPPDLDRLEQLAGELPREHPGFHPEAIVDLLGDPEPEDRCRPVDLGGLAGVVVDAVDPNAARPVAVDVVLAPISGLQEPVLAPPDLSPELDLPLWKFLDERARDWLLPGVGQLRADRVVMVQTNPGFVDALLVGANHQALGELRWRNLPVTTAWTPMRRFWSRIPDPHDPATQHTDIRQIQTWPADSGLGDPRHRTDPASGEDLVVVFRTELFRRYPSTLVYLFPADPNWLQTPQDLPDAQRNYPIFAGSIGPDVVFFGFRVTPAEGRTRWVVLEEPPPGFRFYGETPPDWPAGPTFEQARAQAVNGAAYAGVTFARPVRVFLGNVLA